MHIVPLSVANRTPGADGAALSRAITASTSSGRIDPGASLQRPVVPPPSRTPQLPRRNGVGPADVKLALNNIASSVRRARPGAHPVVAAAAMGAAALPYLMGALKGSRPHGR